MSGTVASIWRHPVKSHGRESLDSAAMIEGRTMPWDRHWAVAHEAAQVDGTQWASCVNFSRVSKAPALQAITAKLDEASATVTLSHPDCDPLKFNPDTDETAFLDWTRPLIPKDRASSARIVRVHDRGMTDTDYPSVSLLNLVSHRAVEQKLGHDISVLRWRGNFILDGLEPWVEFDWIGRKLRIGAAEFEVRERIERCLGTAANPESGQRDVDTLGALENGWGHKDFGVYAKVTKSGRVAVGDTLEVV